MRELRGFWANNVPGSIHGLASAAASLFEPWPWSLITSLDSIRDLRNISRRPAFKAIVDEAAALGTALVVSTPGLIRMAEEGCLTGFDQVWLLSRPPGSAPPDEATLVGPADAVGDDLTATIAWMKSEQCGLGLGDGMGLNYVTTSQPAALEIERVMSVGGISPP